MKQAREHYVTITSFPHYGEHAVLTGLYKDGKPHAVLMDCTHGQRDIWLSKEDVKQKDLL